MIRSIKFRKNTFMFDINGKGLALVLFTRKRMLTFTFFKHDVQFHNKKLNK